LLLRTFSVTAQGCGPAIRTSQVVAGRRAQDDLCVAWSNATFAGAAPDARATYAAALAIVAITAHRQELRKICAVILWKTCENSVRTESQNLRLELSWQHRDVGFGRDDDSLGRSLAHFWPRARTVIASGASSEP
jgi:hypothetical protein